MRQLLLLQDTNFRIPAKKETACSRSLQHFANRGWNANSFALGSHKYMPGESLGNDLASGQVRDRVLEPN